MKKIFTLLFMASVFGSTVYSASIEKVGLNSVTFYNFSVSTYDLSSRVLSVGSSWYPLNSLSVISGNLNLSPSQSVTVGGLSVPTGMGSIGLWEAGTTNSNASASNIIDYVQYGAGGQPYEAIAVQAFLTSVGIYAPGTLPIRRTDANTGPGNGNWVVDATGMATLFDIAALQTMPNPFANELTLSVSESFLNRAQNFPAYWMQT